MAIKQENPFPVVESDRHAIWEMVVRRDIEAFLAADWAMVANDFMEENFMGIDAGGSSNPDSWKITFPDLASYRETWLKQAAEFGGAADTEDARSDLFGATTLRDIEIRGDSALLHKKFDGAVRKKDGTRVPLVWQTLYRCRKISGCWKIVGFTGYMPNPMKATGGLSPVAVKQLPDGASQHVTAGPYSPVLAIQPGKLVVISGQAAIDPEGKIVGESVEEQTRYTLENCGRQLGSAGASLKDVFKVNIFVADLADWSRINAIYQKIVPEPRPVRTAVQTGLLPGLKVEIEMWAVIR